MMAENDSWWVYLIRTKNNALYCGITTDLTRRFKMHQQGKGAKALRGKGPLSLVWWEKVVGRSEALKREAMIKKHPKAVKESMVKEFAGSLLETT
jgi:putative endonuclease